MRAGDYERIINYDWPNYFFGAASFLTHFKSVFPFCTPWKMSSWYIEYKVNFGLKRVEGSFLQLHSYTHGENTLKRTFEKGLLQITTSNFKTT